MPRWSIILALAVLISGAGVGVWQWQHPTFINPLTFADTPVERWINKIFNIGEILTPEPLRGPLNQTGRTLTTAGILSETNRHRAAFDLDPLRPNATLDQAAQKKVADMFARQYFAHEAPDGTGPADLVTGVHYEYIRVGENLALGNFTSDADLVQAWMDSLGHRANILHKGFSEIGLAVDEGIFEGTKVWLAVQTFAAPLSSCPSVDPALQKEFDRLKSSLDQLSQDLATQQKSLTSKEETIARLGQEIKSLAETGNQKIKEGNEQIEQGNKTYKDTGSREAAQPYWDRGEQLQAEGRALLEQAQAKQTEYDALVAQYEAQRNAFNTQAQRQREQNETIATAMSRLNQQIRSFNECIK